MYGIETMENNEVTKSYFHTFSEANREFAFAVARAKETMDSFWYQQQVTGLQYIRLVEYYESRHFGEARSVKQVMEYWEPTK